MFAKALKTQLKSTKKPDFKPHDYQLESIKFQVSKPAAGLFLDPGLGKTAITLSTFKILKAKKLVDILLVLSTSRVMKSVWPKEIDKWENFKDLTYEVLHGPNKDVAFGQLSDVYLLNYEGLKWFATRFKEWSHLKIMLVIDESSHLKTTSSLRFKILKGGKKGRRYFAGMLKQCVRRYILTGTPAPNHLGDLFSQIFLLDLGEALGKYITAFRVEYMSPTGYMGHEWIMNDGAEQQIYKKLKPLVLRFSDDELDLPPLITRTILVELSDKIMKQYRQLEIEFVLELESGVDILAESGASASMKLRQLVGGNIYDGKGKSRVAYKLHDEKLDALSELIDELQGKPLLVGYEFNHELAQLLKRFPHAKHIGGGVSLKDSSDIEDSWNRGEIELLFGQIASVAYGLNLQEGPCSNIAFYTLSWKLSDVVQFIRRVWRQGQKNKVIVHYLIATDTIDRLVVKSLRRKDKNQRALLDAMRSNYLKQETTNMNTVKKSMAQLAEFLNHTDYINDKVIMRKDIHKYLYNILSEVARLNGPLIEDFLYEVFDVDMDANKYNKLDLYDSARSNLIDLLDLKINDKKVYVPRSKTETTKRLKILSKLLTETTMSDKKSTTKKFAAKKAAVTKKPVDKKAAVTKKPVDKKVAVTKKAAVTKKSVAKKPVDKKAAAIKNDRTVAVGTKKAEKGIMLQIQTHIGKNKVTLSSILKSIKLDHKKAKDADFVKYYVLAALRNNFLKETK